MVLTTMGVEDIYDSTDRTAVKNGTCACIIKSDDDHLSVSLRNCMFMTSCIQRAVRFASDVGQTTTNDDG